MNVWRPEIDLENPSKFSEPSLIPASGVFRECGGQKPKQTCDAFHHVGFGLATYHGTDGRITRQALERSTHCGLREAGQPKNDTHDDNKGVKRLRHDLTEILKVRDASRVGVITSRSLATQGVKKVYEGDAMPLT